MSPCSAAIPRGAPWLAPILAVFSLGLSGLAIPSPADAQTVVQHDFEDGTTQGWIPRGTRRPDQHDRGRPTRGTHSLKTTGRTAGFNGPALQPARRAVAGDAVPGDRRGAARSRRAGDPAHRHRAADAASGGTNQFDRVVASAATGVTDGGVGDAAGLLQLRRRRDRPAALRRELEPDRVLLHRRLQHRASCPPLGCSVRQDTTRASTRTSRPARTEGWGPRIGGETVAVTTADAHAGTLQPAHHRPHRPPSTEPRSTPPASCATARATASNLWAKLAPGEAASQLRVSIQRTPRTASTNFNTVVGNTTVTADQWVRLRATYDFVFNYSRSRCTWNRRAGPPPSTSTTSSSPSCRRRSPSATSPSVHETLAPYFPVGAAVWQGDLAGEHAFLLKKHFNSITSENDMKWELDSQPTEGNFTFAARRRAGRVREGEQHAGARPHARLAQPDAGLGVQRRERQPDDADAGEQGAAAAAAARTTSAPW